MLIFLKYRSWYTIAEPRLSFDQLQILTWLLTFTFTEVEDRSTGYIEVPPPWGIKPLCPTIRVGCPEWVESTVIVSTIVTFYPVSTSRQVNRNVFPLVSCSQTAFFLFLGVGKKLEGSGTLTPVKNSVHRSQGDSWLLLIDESLYFIHLLMITRDVTLLHAAQPTAHITCCTSRWPRYPRRAWMTVAVFVNYHYHLPL